jgi:hypothetical protein
MVRHTNNGTMCIGSKHSFARYKNSKYVCESCLKQFEPLMTVKNTFDCLEASKECDTCEEISSPIFTFIAKPKPGQSLDQVGINMEDTLNCLETSRQWLLEIYDTCSLKELGTSNLITLKTFVNKLTSVLNRRRGDQVLNKTECK